VADAGHREVELKWTLDAAGYRLVLAGVAAIASGPEIQVQSNRFYDTADQDLRTGGLALRIRRENRAVVLTCKRRLAEQDAGLHQHHEWECALDPDLWKALAAIDRLPDGLPLPEAVQQVVAGRPLLLLGGFENLRHQFRLGDEIVAVDRTEFAADQCEFELEVETHDPLGARRRWRSLLGDWGVAATAQPLTKMHRLLARRADDRRDDAVYGPSR